MKFFIFRNLSASWECGGGGEEQISPGGTERILPYSLALQLPWWKWMLYRLHTLTAAMSLGTGNTYVAKGASEQ